MTPTPLLRASLVLALGVLGAFVATAAPLPIWFSPLDGVLVLGEKPSGVVIDYYGRIVGTLLGVGVGAVAGVALERRLTPAQQLRAARVLVAQAALGGLLCLGMSLAQVWNRALTPLSPTAIGLPAKGPSTSLRPGR